MKVLVLIGSVLLVQLLILQPVKIVGGKVQRYISRSRVPAALYVSQLSSPQRLTSEVRLSSSPRTFTPVIDSKPRNYNPIAKGEGSAYSFLNSRLSSVQHHRDKSTTQVGDDAWWLKDVPWFLPPPPEWGPMPPQMYMSYWHKPKNAPLTSPNYYPLYSRAFEYLQNSKPLPNAPTPVTIASILAGTIPSKSPNDPGTPLYPQIQVLDQTPYPNPPTPDTFASLAAALTTPGTMPSTVSTYYPNLGGLPTVGNALPPPVGPMGPQDVNLVFPAATAILLPTPVTDPSSLRNPQSFPILLDTHSTIHPLRRRLNSQISHNSLHKFQRTFQSRNSDKI